MRKLKYIVVCLFVVAAFNTDFMIGQERLAMIQQAQESLSSSGNVAFVTQVGEENTVGIKQQGLNNVVVTEQRGDDNSLMLKQQGNRNAIINTSVGNSNRITFDQVGDDNSIFEITRGNNNQISIEQNGDDNQANSITLGSNYNVSIQQNGDGNMVTGWHLGNAQGGSDQPTEIIQTGNNNELYTEINGTKVLSIKQRNGASATVKQY